MKKFVSFLVLAVTTLVFFSSCFQKYREPEADDGTGVSAASKWDWKGTAPFSGILGGEPQHAPSNSNQEKVISTKTGIMVVSIIEPLQENSNITSRTYIFNLGKDLKPGIYVSTQENTVIFNFAYTPQQEGIPGRPLKSFLTHKLVLKLIRNDDDIAEGYFYGKIMNVQNPMELMEVKDAYFRIEKSGAIIIN